MDQYWNLINFLLFEIHSHVPNCNFGPLSNFSNTHFGSDSKSNPTRDTKTPSKTFLNKNWTQSYLFKPIRVYRFLQREQCNTVLSTHYRWLFLGNRFWILFLEKSVKEEVYPDSKILSRELRKVSREAKQEIKKAESNRKNSKKMLKFLNKNFTPSKLWKSHSCKLIIAVYYSFIMSHCGVFISGLMWDDYYLSTEITSRHKKIRITFFGFFLISKVSFDIFLLEKKIMRWSLIKSTLI